MIEERDFLRVEAGDKEDDAFLRDAYCVGAVAEDSELRALPMTTTSLNINYGSTVGGSKRHVPTTPAPAPAHRPSRHADAIRFGLRFSVILTTGSLFMIVPWPGHDGKMFPSGVWIFITCIFVSWYPSLDAASVVEKALYRIMGTTAGGLLAIVAGCLSTRLSKHDEPIFLTSFTALLGFVIPYLATRSKPSSVTVTYAYIIAIMTYGIAVLPFIKNDERRIRHAALRALNVIIGCIISCIGAVTICPRSTNAVVRDIFADVMDLSGTACGAVLRQASKAFSGRQSLCPERITKALLEGRTDPVHAKYLSVTEKLRTAKPLLRFLDSDPMRFIFPMEKLIGKAGASLFTTRAFRVIQTVILVDSLVRNKMDSLGFSADEVRLLDEIGNLLESMLKCATGDDFESLEEEAFRMFGDLHDARYNALTREAEAVRGKGKGWRNEMHGSQEDWLQMLAGEDTRVPLLDYDTADYGRILVFGMIEHLIMRTIRLCYTWRGIGGIHEQSKSSRSFSRQQSVLKPSASEDVFLTLMDTGSEDYDNRID